MKAPLVEARGLVKRYERRRGAWGLGRETLAAVRGVDLDVYPGETLGLVGESGSGKSTLGRLLIRLVDPDGGTIRFDGADLLSLRGRELRRMRRQFQIVFQDPWGSLNPRMRIGTAIGEPLVVHRLVRGRAERRRRVDELLEQVGLDASAAERYPHEFSGGQRQRIGIARAIACSPRFVVADEPVSALDPPIQAQIINLLIDLQERLGLAYLLIAHDLRLVEHVADRVAVMHAGRIVEQAPAERLYRSPLHPYTRSLLASTPPVPGAAPLAGPDARAHEPFVQRCEGAGSCRPGEPRLVEVEPGHRVACHLLLTSGGRGAG